MIGSVRDRRTFVALRDEGIRVRRGPLSVVLLPDDGANTTRAAYAITKRVGGAVERNRLRRRLRAVLESLAADPDVDVPTGALLISAGAQVADRNPGELRNDVKTMLVALESRRRNDEAR